MPNRFRFISYNPSLRLGASFFGRVIVSPPLSSVSFSYDKEQQEHSFKTQKEMYTDMQGPFERRLELCYDKEKLIDFYIVK